eukprot:CAMPEP_0197466222 /NCGR_PEP_ID=MMETSP1175-20131217/64928_1 /TAXON_ID=1003142 /ORGANISM="Triceratium dubium, Strain CCMP147" /LENGTH=534 /DNA_ID=CAMNT_0043002253 /DNA_START=53 /DNA_END=1657 /DNA_ORIENTATION=+
MADTANYGAVPPSEEATKSRGHGIEMPDDSRPTCRNPIMALLFIAHLVVIALTGAKYGTFSLPEELESAADYAAKAADSVVDYEEDVLNGQEEGEFWRGVALRLALPCAAFSFIVAYVVAAFVLPKCAQAAVRLCLFLSFFVTVGLAVAFSIQYPIWWVYTISGILSVLAAVYTCKVWKLVPFAVANLKVAIKGMTENGGTYIIALIFAILAFIWAIGWFYVANGVYALREVYGKSSLCDDPEAAAAAGVSINGLDCEQTSDEVAKFGGIMFGLLVSLYWTIAVILNCVRVMVAGTMATWCIDKEDASSCCSPAVLSSFVRSMVFSFGSVCFGSLVEGVAAAINAAMQYAKSAADADGDATDCNSRLFGCLVCLTKCFEDMIEYFNQWAYVYIGIYGYGYIKSGREVMKLFRERGWTSIVSDFLVSYVLNFTSILVGALTGGLGILLDINDTVGSAGYWDSFVVGFLIGLLVTHVMMNVIKGAVNTAIVIFADKPDEMAKNHPVMTKEMAEAWLDAYPDCGVPNPSDPIYAVVV